MPLDAMTYNIKFDARDYPWAPRRRLVDELLHQTNPQLLAVQEAMYQQVRDLARDRYEWIGLGRGSGSKDEFAAILFDPDVLEPLEFDHFWLSETPDLMASRTPAWGNDVIRMATWARFRMGTTEFGWLNTHLDHAAEVARCKGAQLIVDRVQQWPADLPLIVSGDFNAEPDSEPHRILCKEGGFTDTWDLADAPKIGTYGGWSAPTADSSRIDWVLVRGPVTVGSAGICDYHDGDDWPSDHVPVQVRLRFADEP